MSNAVYCYQHDWPNTHNEWGRQIWLWQQHWRGLGWNPQVLSDVTAQKDPDYDRLKEVVSRYPTVNTAVYEEACFLRHLAFRHVGAELLSDYDVLNFDFQPVNVWDFPASGMISFDVEGNISLAAFTPAGRDRLITAFLDETFVMETALRHIDGAPHVSDMAVFKMLKPRIVRNSDSLANLKRAGKSPTHYRTLHVNNDSALAYGINPGSKSTLMTDILLRRKQFHKLE